jgi:hypothetical protein
MKDERDTQKMATLPVEEPAGPAVRRFKYDTTDPGKSLDPDHELVRGVSRARDNRDDRSESIGKILDELPVDESPRAPVAITPARPVRIVHKWSMPTWIAIAAITIAVGVLTIALAIASKGKKEIIVTATSTPIATSAAPTHTSTAPVVPTIIATTTAVPVPTVTATATHSAHVTTAPTATATASTAPTTEHHDNDIVRTPEL